MLIELFSNMVNEELFEQKLGEIQVILFGEGYGAKIQNNVNYHSDVSFILFDGYLPKQNLWLKRDTIEDIAQTFGIDAVPVIKGRMIAETLQFVKSKVCNFE